MFHDSFTATNAERSKRFLIGRNARRIMIERVGAKLFNGRLAQLPETISLELADKSSNLIQMISRIPIGPLACFSQFGEGSISIIHDFGGTGNYVIELPVDIAPELAVKLNTTEEFALLIEDMEPGHTYRIYVQEGHLTGTNYNEWSRIPLAAGQSTKSLNVDDVECLVIPTKWVGPNTTGVNRVVITYANGTNNDYKLSEILQLNADNNDAESIFMRTEDDQPPTPGVVTSSRISDYAILMVRNATDVMIETDGNAVTIYQLRIKSRL